MKKFVSFLTSFALVLGLLGVLSSCGKKTDDVHIFYYTYSDTYISTVRSALDRALSSMSLSFQNHDSAGSQTTQTEQVQTAVTKGAKLIVVNIVNTGSDDAAMGIVSIARDAGIPVVFFNREVSDAVVKSYDKCAFIGTDAEEAGHLQGEMIGDYLAENFDAVDLNGDGEISYIMFKGEEGNNEAIYRTTYSVEDANRILGQHGRKPLKFYDASNPNKYLVDKNGQWSAAAANEFMTTALSSYSEGSGNMIELVICNNDNMAEGAINALGTVGYNTGTGKSIPVFGIDATDAAKALVADKKMAGTIKQDSEAMAKAIALLVSNAIGDMDLLTGTEGYTIDNDARKIRIHYSKYLG